jgi:hypothetical protein
MPLSEFLDATEKLQVGTESVALEREQSSFESEQSSAKNFRIQACLCCEKCLQADKLQPSEKCR